MRAPLVLLALCLAGSPGCRREGPEARLRRAFATAVAAVEAGDAAGAAAVLSPGFMGPEGMDRAGARLFLAAVLRREKIGITVLTQTVELDGHRGQQHVDLLLTGRTGGGLLPEERSRRSLDLRWEERGGDWLIREVVEGPS